jgi:hypothetical protein
MSTRYFCDKCNTEVCDSWDLLKVGIGDETFELCGSCYDDLKELVGKWVRRKKVKV